MTRVPVSKKHTSSNESTKLVDETSSSYIHIHAHTFLSISPVHRSKKKKKKENKGTHSGKHVHARKKKRKKNSYLNSCMLLTRAYILYVPVYRLLCSYSSTVLLLIFERIVSILFLSWLTNEEKKKKKKESNWEEFPREFCALTWFVCRWNSRGNSSEAKGVLESRKLFVRGADDLYKFMIINEGKENRRHPNSP